MGDALTITVRSERGVVIAAVTGEIDISTVAQLRERLFELADNGGTLIVDLNRDTFIDSAGLGALVGTARRAAAHGGSLHAVCARPQTRKLLWMTGVDRRIPLTATVDGALMLIAASRGSSGSGTLSGGLLGRLRGWRHGGSGAVEWFGVGERAAKPWLVCAQDAPSATHARDGSRGRAEDGNRFVVTVVALEADPQRSAGTQFGGIRLDDLGPPPGAFGQFGEAQDGAAGFSGGIGFAVGNGPADQGCVG